MVRAGAMVGVRAAAGAAAGKAGGAGETEGQRSRGRPQAPSSPAGVGPAPPAAGRDGSIRFGISLIPRSFALEPVDSGVGKAWISLDSLVRNEPFQWVTRDFPRKKFAGPCPSAGGGGTGEAERRNGRKRRSRGEDRSWSELSAASGFLQSIVVRHALAEIVAPNIARRRLLSAASLGPAPGFSIAPIAHAARGVVRKTSNASRTRNDGVGPRIVVAEFDQPCGLVERLAEGADLAADEPVLRQVVEERDGAQQRRVASFRFDCQPQSDT